MFIVEGIDILEETGKLWTALPTLRKLQGRPGHSSLPSCLHSALRWAGQGSEKIGGSLARRAVEAHVGKEVTGLAGRAEVDLLALVQDDDLVKDLSQLEYQ